MYIYIYIWLILDKISKIFLSKIDFIDARYLASIKLDDLVSKKE